MVGYQNNKYKLEDNGAIQPEYVARWYAFCSFSEGDDYGVWIDAITGDLLNLTRYPMDWFDDKKDLGEFQVLQEGKFSDEDILKAASDYLENLGLTVDNVEFASSYSREDILLKSLNYGEKVKIPTRRVYAYLSDGKSVNINFLEDDLTIQAIDVK